MILPQDGPGDSNPKIAAAKVPLTRIGLRWKASLSSEEPLCAALLYVL